MHCIYMFKLQSAHGVTDVCICAAGKKAALMSDPIEDQIGPACGGGVGDS